MLRHYENHIFQSPYPLLHGFNPQCCYCFCCCTILYICLILLRLYALYFISCCKYSALYCTTQCCNFHFIFLKLSFFYSALQHLQCWEKKWKMYTWSIFLTTFQHFPSSLASLLHFLSPTFTTSRATKSKHCNFSRPAHRWPQDSANRSCLGLADPSILMAWPCHLCLHPST